MLISTQKSFNNFENSSCFLSSYFSKVFKHLKKTLHGVNLKHAEWDDYSTDIEVEASGLTIELLVHTPNTCSQNNPMHNRII